MKKRTERLLAVTGAALLLFIGGDDRFEQKYTPEPNTGCWLWTASTVLGYGQFYDHRYRRPRRAHIWAYEHFVGPVPEGLELDHLCRNTLCVNPAHLEPVTHLENVRRGTAGNHQHHARGTSNGQSKLTAEQVIEIRSTPMTRGTVSKLALKYGIGKTTVRHILEGDTWGHLDVA